jgi:hypothetical protein
MTESPKPATQGDLLWCGEHWIAYLRRPGEERESGMLSLYRAYSSPAGQGTVPGEPFLRDAWAKTLRVPKSSCCFALAETMVQR